MNEIYSNIDNPAGLGSIDKLYREIKKVDKKITKNDVKLFLSTQDSYTLHKVMPRKFPRRKYLFTRPGHTLICDVFYLNPIVKTKTPYILILIDGYSRYLNIIPLHSLKADTIVPLFEKMLNENIYRYSKIYSDCGQEFQSLKIKQMYKKLNITWYTTYSKEIKASIAERVILTIKRKIVKFITHFNSNAVIPAIYKIVETYNDTNHRMLMYCKPIDIHMLSNWEEIKSFSQKIYKKFNSKIQLVKVKLSIGQVVRLNTARKLFKRAQHIQNTIELFKIVKINENHIPITYNISEVDNDEEIEGVFYHQELIPTFDSGNYRITILKTRKKKKKTEYLVNYEDYPNSKPSWISSKLLKK